jgi:hypothetical protein
MRQRFFFKNEVKGSIDRSTEENKKKRGRSKVFWDSSFSTSAVAYWANSVRVAKAIR